jgi:shikimate dehydrogenase
MNDAPLPILAGLMGWPVHQSKSPLIHSHWLNALGIDGAYVRFPVRPGHVEAALRGMSSLGIVGMQATMPHKRACFEAVDALSDAARALGAVNTVTVQADGSLRGHNSDLAGFLEPLVDVDLEGKAVTVLGAGGAAAALAVGLASKKPARITIINRSAQGIDRLLGDIAESLEDIEIRTGGWDQVQGLIGDEALLANATSLGMAGQPPLPLDVGALPVGAIVYDIITHPHDTDLLKAARGRGLTTFDGMQMLIGQAREGFELFYGQTAPASEDGAVRRLLLA